MALSSVGLVFILVAIGVVTYFVVGGLVRYHGGLRHCPEVLPHYQFWCKLGSSCLRLITCGRYCGRLGMDRDVAWAGASGSINTLPSRPTVVQNVRFETLLSDEEITLDDRRALEPAEVVVKY